MQLYQVPAANGTQCPPIPRVVRWPDFSGGFNSQEGGRLQKVSVSRLWWTASMVLMAKKTK
ncbi:MAG: hypothetical protein ACK5Q5_08925, partial [Planctomycetaceae bacterium]